MRSVASPRGYHRVQKRYRPDHLRSFPPQCGTTMAEHQVERLGVSEQQYPPWFERAACSAIVHSLPHAVLLVDARLDIVLVNRAAAKLFGRNPARLRGVSIGQLLPADAIGVLLQEI